MPDKNPSPVTVNFSLVGDQFPHAWFFNRFRVDRLGKSYLVTLGLATDAGGIIAVNAFVIGQTDHEHNKARALKYVENFAEIAADPTYQLGFSSPPARVYPVNHINLSRVGEQAELGLYRFSINSLVDSMRESKKQAAVKNPSVNCYPVVMFRSDLPLQIALMKEIYSYEAD